MSGPQLRGMEGQLDGSTRWKLSKGPLILLQRIFFLWVLAFQPHIALAQTTSSSSSTPPPTAESVDFDYETWKPCEKTSLEFAETLTPDDDVAPCVLYDIQPPPYSNIFSSSATNTNNNVNGSVPFVVTLVQVTPAASNCQNGRDGAVMSVELLNSQNEARGQAIGFHQSTFVQFRLISIVAGHADYISGDYYKARHAKVLDAALTALKPQYVIGTCSFVSDAEDEVVWEHKVMLAAQVGPPSYYQSGNPYLFGFHLNSDGYPLAAVRALGFDVQARQGTLANQPVKVLYRTKSEFFYSTCRSAIDALKQVGFTNVVELLYDHDEDHDGDGEKNQFDQDFLYDLADQACPPMGTTNTNNNNHSHGDNLTEPAQQSSSSDLQPAIFACFLSEQDMVFQRWRENGCCPMSIWLTAATWGWARNNQDQIPYIQGGGQWHEAFTYSDQFFTSGLELLEQGKQTFGYVGSYDFVVSYAIPALFAEHLKSAYRVVDDPDPAQDFQSADGYEKLRRDMVILNAHTLFGPVSFDQNQRNMGRASAGTQWLIASDNGGGNVTYHNALVSPSNQAQAPIIVPSPSAEPCPPGQYANETMVVNGTALLTSKCSPCPENTITFQHNNDLQCSPCPEDSTTQGRIGESRCFRNDENLISQPALNLGYAFVGITWTLALGFAGWMFYFREDPVVLIAQQSFMFVICVGAVISSCTILALSQQAGVDEDTSAATTACRLAPFLYCIGWPLQYGCLCSKTFRICRIMRGMRYRRVRITAFHTSWIVILVLVLDLSIVIAWTLVDPLEYRREVTDTSVSEEGGLPLVTMSSYGWCSPPVGSSVWPYAGPIAGIHLLLMIVTNWTLYTVRGLEDRYQEQKYVGLSSAFVFEVLVIGLPVLLSLDYNPSASFLVLVCVIFFNDAGILCFIFIPKIHFQRQGLSTGVGVVESLRRSTHEKAMNRQRQMSFGRGDFPSDIRASDVAMDSNGQGGIDIEKNSCDSFANAGHNSESFSPHRPPSGRLDSNGHMESSFTHVTVRDSAIVSRSDHDRSNRSFKVSSVKNDLDPADQVQDLIKEEQSFLLEQENKQLKQQVRRLETELQALLPRKTEDGGSIDLIEGVADDITV